MERLSGAILLLVTLIFLQQLQPTRPAIGATIVAGMGIANQILSLANNILNLVERDSASDTDTLYTENMDSSNVNTIIENLRHIRDVVEGIEQTQEKLKTYVELQPYYNFIGVIYRNIVAALGELEQMLELNSTNEFIATYEAKGIEFTTKDLFKGATDPRYISKQQGTLPVAFAKSFRCDMTRMETEANEYINLQGSAVLLETVYNNITDRQSMVRQRKNETEMIARAFKVQIDICKREFAGFAKDDLEEAASPRRLNDASLSRYNWLCPEVFFYHGGIAANHINVIGNKTSLYYSYNEEKHEHKFMIFADKTASIPASAYSLVSETGNIQYDDASTVCRNVIDLLETSNIPYSAVLCADFSVNFKSVEGCDTQRIKLYIPTFTEAKYVVYVYFANKYPSPSFNPFELAISTETPESSGGARLFHSNFITVVFAIYFSIL